MVEDLIMDKVLPAKRVAIEKFTDRPDRPGFTDTNDPYTSCLREIDRRMKGTAFDNPVDDDDLKCRAIALVADQHEEILATQDSAEREAMQHAVPQKVFDSFLRNKFPKVRFLKTLPDKVRLPGGEIFTVNQSPANPARNSMIVGPDEKTEQAGFINASFGDGSPAGGQSPDLSPDEATSRRGQLTDEALLSRARAAKIDQPIFIDVGIENSNMIEMPLVSIDIESGGVRIPPANLGAREELTIFGFGGGNTGFSVMLTNTTEVAQTIGDVSGLDIRFSATPPRDISKLPVNSEAISRLASPTAKTQSRGAWRYRGGWWRNHDHNYIGKIRAR